jgi:hypothetical protein
MNIPSVDQSCPSTDRIFPLWTNRRVAAINTIQSVMGINLKTLRPEPSVEGYSTPGGYSAKVTP